MSTHDNTPRLRDIVTQVGAQSLTLSFYNPDVPRSVLRDVQSYFDVQSVDLRRAATDDGRPRNFVVLHDDDEFVAASDLESVYRVVRPDSPLLDLSDPADVDYPDVLQAIDQSVFTDYGRARMITASREIESAAAQHGGTLHSGFQRLSNLRPQYRFYERIADAGVDTHIYGAPDWDVPTDAHTVHVSDDPELTETWFVVLDADADGQQRALLAEERSDNQFYGFWTFDPTIVDVVLARLAELRARL